MRAPAGRRTPRRRRSCGGRRTSWPCRSACESSLRKLSATSADRRRLFAMVAPSEWDAVVQEWSPSSPHARLRSYSDAVTARFVEQWLNGARAHTALKTDAFDESV